MLVRTRNHNDPFADLFRLHDAFFGPLSRPNGRVVEKYTPAVDLWEDDEAYWVEAELPGVKAEDVDIALEDNVLTLKGERRLEKNLEKKDEGGGFRHTERVHGKFTRAFRFPEAVDADAVEATLEEGVLKVRLPKKAEARSRKILVKAAA